MKISLTRIPSKSIDTRSLLLIISHCGTIMFFFLMFLYGTVGNEICPSESPSTAVISHPTQESHSFDVKPDSKKKSRHLSYGAISGIITGCMAIEAVILIAVVLVRSMSFVFELNTWQSTLSFKMSH